ncbi:MAG: pitrilysin family protein, partial [Kofleriaceae bacterium]|nr:pitrilysin family protein [Kofleriaceae bacterium]
MKRQLLPLALACALVPAVAQADEPRIAYQKFELPNGLKVYVIEDPKAPTVYEVLWFEVGSKDEVANRTGFAHLFEHLMFKGSAHLPDGLMDRLLESAGGWSNAFTSSDMTVYQNVAASNFLEQILWMEADRFAGLLDTFDKPKLDNQRDVVLNERRQRYENVPYGMAWEYLAEALYPKDHPYAHTAIGSPKDLQAATLADVRAFFQQFYVPANAVLTVVGDQEIAKTKALINTYFGSIPGGSRAATPAGGAPPKREPVHLATSDDKAKLPRVTLAWHTPALYTPGDAELDLLSTVLTDGKTSRLYEPLVYRSKLAKDVSA